MNAISIVCLNGPPRAGKDTTAGMLARRGWTELKMSSPLKTGGASIFGVDAIEMEEGKDLPREELLGETWRNVQIWLSEQCMKPKFGKDVFSTLMINHIESLYRDGVDQFVISDIGFQIEYDTIAAHFGNENLMLVHINQDGRDFSKDSRDWVYPSPGFPLYKIYNNESYKLLNDRIFKAVKLWRPTLIF